MLFYQFSRRRCIHYLIFSIVSNILKADSRIGRYIYSDILTHKKLLGLQNNMESFLNKMSEPEFIQYLENAIQEYARENIESGRWLSEGAIERSHSDHERLLPKGIETKNNYLFNILSPEDGGIVGSLWLSIEEHAQNNSAFIYDIEVNKNYRRKGYATGALREIEEFVKTLGIKTLGLHVFRQNTSAQKLYASLGYNIVSTNMVKSLA